MIFLNNGAIFLSFTVNNLFKIIGLGTIIIFLVSCGNEIVRTEAEYIDVATEAHAFGNSKLALFELATGIKNYPENAEIQLLRGKIFLDLEDGSAAEIAFNKSIALGYNRDFIKHEIAESWMLQRNPAKVIEILEKEILQGSRDALIYEVVGRAYIATRDRTNPTLFLKNMNIAEKYIGEAFHINPKNTRVLISKAWLSAMMGKLDDAIQWLDNADLIIKDQRQNLIIKGELLIRQDKLDPAQVVYSKLVEKFPQYPQYKVELGYTYLLNRDYPKSRVWIEPIAEQYPNQLRPKYLLANISLMERKYEDAKRLSDAIIAQSPEDLPAIIINGASSYFLGDFENAHQKLNHFYNRTGSIPALKLLAATKLKLNENIDAAKLLEESGQSIENQSDMEMLNLVAIASAKIGKMDVALEAYQKLADQQPDTPFYKNNVGQIQIAQGNYDEGFENLEKALEDDNAKDEPGQNLHTLAKKALRSRQYERAAAYIEQYKKVAPDNYKPWVISAVLQSILKNNDKVREDFDKAVEIAPDVAEVKARYAIFETMQGNKDKSIKLATQALKLDPSNYGAGKLVLTDLIKLKKFTEVKNIVDKAVKDKNASEISKLIFADYYIFLGTPQKTLNILEKLPNTLKATAPYKIISGKAYLRNGQAQSAVDMLEGFSQNNPNNIQAIKHLLRGYLLTKNKTKYQATLEIINGLEPNKYENQINLANLYASTGDYELAEKTLGTIKPNTGLQILQKELLQASIETNRGDIEKAISILSPLYEKFPKNGGVSMLYARNLAADNQVDKAINISKIWAAQHLDNLDVKQFLGDLYMRNKDTVSASLQYEEILSAEGKIPAKIEFHSHNNLAIIYIGKNQNEKAMKHAQKALDMAPNNPGVVDTYAQVLMKSGQAEKAVDHFNQALALLPNSDRKNLSLFTLGKAKALIQIGRVDDAKKILNRLIKNNPSFSQIKEVNEILSGL